MFFGLIWRRVALFFAAIVLLCVAIVYHFFLSLVARGTDGGDGGNSGGVVCGGDIVRLLFEHASLLLRNTQELK